MNCLQPFCLHTKLTTLHNTMHLVTVNSAPMMIFVCVAMIALDLPWSCPSSRLVKHLFSFYFCHCLTLSLMLLFWSLCTCIVTCIVTFLDTADTVALLLNYLNFLGYCWSINFTSDLFKFLKDDACWLTSIWLTYLDSCTCCVSLLLKS